MSLNSRLRRIETKRPPEGSEMPSVVILVLVKEDRIDGVRTEWEAGREERCYQRRNRPGVVLWDFEREFVVADEDEG